MKREQSKMQGKAKRKPVQDAKTLEALKKAKAALVAQRIKILKEVIMGFMPILPKDFQLSKFPDNPEEMKALAIKFGMFFLFTYLLTTIPLHILIFVIHVCIFSSCSSSPSTYSSL